MRIEDCVALITGGANGIGACCARVLAARGARVAVCDLAPDSLDRVVEEIRSAGGEAVGIPGDVTREEDQERFVAGTLEAFGHLNVVVPSAGIIHDATLVTTDRETGRVVQKMTLQQWQQVLDVNLTGTFLTVRESVEAMVNGGWDGLVCLISSVSKDGQVGQLNYSSSKAAVALMPKILVGEFVLRRIRNVRVVGIAPGFVNTSILGNMNQSALAAMLEDVHLGRLVEPEEISDVLCHCIENEALNGTTIEVTGGLTYTRSRAR